MDNHIVVGEEPYKDFVGDASLVATFLVVLPSLVAVAYLVDRFGAYSIAVEALATTVGTQVVPSRASHQLEVLNTFVVKEASLVVFRGPFLYLFFKDIN